MGTMEKPAPVQQEISLRKGAMFIEVYTDIKRLRLNWVPTQDTINQLFDEAEKRGMYVDLSRINLSGLHGLKLAGRDLSWADLTETKFSEADFATANFSNAKLIKAIFIKSDFTRAKFHNSDVRKADFSYAVSFEAVSGLETARNLGSAKFYGVKHLSKRDKEAILNADPNLSKQERERILKESPTARFGWA